MELSSRVRKDGQGRIYVTQVRERGVAVLKVDSGEEGKES